MSEQNKFLPFPKGFATTAIHHAQEPEQWDSMAIVTPIITSTNYKETGQTKNKKFEYSREGNPTREVLERVLAKLENGKYALAFSSGMGSISALLGLLHTGDHLICGIDTYIGTTNLLHKIAPQFGIEITAVDLRNVSNFEKAIRKNTKLAFFETPSNPMMHVADIRAISTIAKKYSIIVAVDNTFLTPYLTKPLELGADIVNYSLSKYMNGHTDVVMGAIVTSDAALREKLYFVQYTMGSVPSPFDCYQVNRGIKTLALRMQQHNKSSLIIAKYLEEHPKVEKVLHPGLPSHPQHVLFKSQTSGHSGIFSFYLKGTLETPKKFVASLKIFAFAASLGGFESLVEVPFQTTHSSLTPEKRALLEVTETLVRVSVGLEDTEDLIADLEQAFNAV